MNEPVKLVTTKPDTEVAAELKQEIIEALKPALAVATKALKQGFHLQMNMGPNAFGEVVIQQLNLVKTF